MLLDALSIFALVSFLALAAIMEIGGTVHRRVAIIAALVAVENALFIVGHVSVVAFAVIKAGGTVHRWGAINGALVAVDNALFTVGHVSVVAFAVIKAGGTVHRRGAIIGALVAVGNALFSVRHVSFLALAVMETFGTLLGLLRLGRALEALLLLDAPIIIGDVSVHASTVVEILGAAPLSLQQYCEHCIV